MSEKRMKAKKAIRQKAFFQRVGSYDKIDAVRLSVGKVKVKSMRMHTKSSFDMIFCTILPSTLAQVHAGFN